MDKDTSITPGSTVDVDGGSRIEDGTVGDSSCYAGLLVEPSTGTYGNGVAVMTANYGDSNTVEALARQIEIDKIHPTSNSPYDLTTVYTAGQHVNIVVHQVNKVYWLKGSSITTVKNQTHLVPAGSGLVKAQLAHTATALPMHTWVARQTVSSATWVKGQYLGFKSFYTAA